jgi:RHS repeat-associated protein
MNYGYTGKPWDATTGLYDYGYRDYAPSVARFTTVDPVRDGNNWFSYVNNDPVNWVDPWGLSANDNADGETSITPDPTPEPPVQPQEATDPSDYHCDIYAWNEALNDGYDPRSQDGTEWNGNNETVPDIFGNYPDNRTNTPPDNTNGYGFYDSPNDNDTTPEHMEYYDNTDNDADNYTRHRTDGIDTPTDTAWPENVNGWTFVPLNQN